MNTNWTKKISMTVLLAGLAWPVLAQPKIGIIDMTRVFENFYKTKAANATMRDYLADLDKGQRDVIEDLNKAREEYKKAFDESNNQAISADEREKAKKLAESKFKEVRDKEQELEMYNRRADANVREKRRQIFDKIMEEVRTVVSAQAKAAGFTLVLDSTAESARGTPMVLYNNGANDLTSAVLAQLNALAPATGPGSDDKKTNTPAPLK